MIKKLFQYILRFFQKEVKPEVLEPIEEKVEEKKQRKKYTSHKEERATFSELLDGIESTFESYRFPTLDSSWLDRDSIIGLRKLGSHVPSHWNNLFEADQVTEDKIRCQNLNKLPALMCVSIGYKLNSKEENGLPARFVFAIKHKKLPWNVGYKQGTPYLFGTAHEKDGKLHWIYMWITVNRHSGQVEVCPELGPSFSYIPSKNSASKRSDGVVRKVMRMQWMPPNFLSGLVNKNIDQARRDHKLLFVTILDWWVKREEQWNVIVKHNGERLTFSVPNDQTKFYFKDRERVVNENGNSKKIVHYVKEHGRLYGEKVTVIKEHIKGLRQFNWKGYNIQVVSPKLQANTSAAFTPGGEEIEEMEKGNVVYLSKLGKMLADAEEMRFK